mmetsp:Transcript_8216/g.4360  ORF Transcript_8216/g.4360 Transcript_8216/m.4360 type:complete len:114 (-) Transcript_8216:1157-1498(-)
MITTDLQTYIHRELNQEITAIGGHYMFTNEIRLPFQGRDVLYLIGCALFDNTCCGAGGCSYALVWGFIENWKIRKNKEGFPVSMVKPVRDPILQQQIRKLIKDKERVQQVRFE